MTTIQKSLSMGVLCFVLAGLPGSLFAQSPPEENSQAVIALLKEQHNQLSGDLRRIHREIAALRADINQPGIKDVFAGIGYILGLFGVAGFVAARRKE
jgi:hypothetical protein